MKYALYQAPDTTDAPGEIIICDADETYMGKPMDEYTKAGWKRIGCIESDMNYFGIVQGFNASWQRINVKKCLMQCFMQRNILLKQKQFGIRRAEPEDTLWKNCWNASAYSRKRNSRKK